MRRSVAIGLFALGLIACTPLPDIVAYEPEGSEPVVPTSPPPTGAPVPSAVPVQCMKTGSTVVLRTKDGRIASLPDRGSQARFYPIPPDCLAQSPEPVALSSDGTVWAVSGGKVVALDASGACKQLSLALSATAMAFVIDPKLGREQLYAIVDGLLVVIDPATLLRTPIGKVSLAEVTGLAGTLDGRLLAIAGRGRPVITEIYLGDASPGPGFGVALDAAADEPILGIALTPGAVALVSDSAIHWVDPKLSSTAERMSYGVAGTVAAGGSPCSYSAL